MDREHRGRAHRGTHRRDPGVASFSFAAVLVILFAIPLAAPAQDPAAARLLREADRLLQGGNPEAALEELQLLVQQFPDDQLTPRALLRVAHLQRGRGVDGSALRALDRLIEQHGRSEEAAVAMLIKAEMAIDRATGTTELEDARTAVRRVPLLFGRDAYPTLEARRQARTLSGEICLLLGDDTAAAADFVAAIEDEPPSPAVGRAQLGLARAWLRTGDLAAAAEVLERLRGAGDDVSDTVARQRAGDLLGLVHRRLLRVRGGRPHWGNVGRYPPAGLELREVSGVAAAVDGRVLVVDARLPLVAVIGADGSVTSRQAIRGAERPGFDPQGLPFVATEENLLHPWGGRSRSFTDPRRGAPLKGMVAAATGAFNDAYVVVKGAKSLLHFRADGKGRELLLEQRPEIVDVARDALGRIYALDERGRTVLRLDRDGRLQGSAAGSAGWKRPAAIDVDALGFLYVVDRANARLELFSPQGRLVAAAGPSLGGGIELRSPVDVAVDGRGRVFIADSKLPFLVMID